MKLVET